MPSGEDLADMVLLTELEIPRLVHPSHSPRRGSDVEAWLKAERDKYQERTEAWYALDELLDDYRLRADTGRGLM